MYRVSEMSLSKKAMEEVMKATNAHATSMCKDDPTPYIVEGLTDLAIKHAEFIPGVARQLTAIAIKESDVKAQSSFGPI